MTEPIEVVVIGGGYAGVMAANRLTRRADVAVTLVNPRPMFVDRIRLHHVTDFIDVNWWTFRIFNLADSFIVVGVVILLVALVAADRAPRPPRRTLDVAAR